MSRLLSTALEMGGKRRSWVIKPNFWGPSSRKGGRALAARGEKLTQRKVLFCTEMVFFVFSDQVSKTQGQTHVWLDFSKETYQRKQDLCLGWIMLLLDMVAHAFHPNTWEAVADGWLYLSARPGLQSKTLERGGGQEIISHPEASKEWTFLSISRKIASSPSEWTVWASSH